MQTARLVVFVPNSVAHQIVGFHGDLRAEVDPVAGAENSISRALQQVRQPRGQPDARREILAIRCGDGVHMAQHRRVRQCRIIEIQQIPAILAERREVFVAQSRGYADARSNAPIVLHVARVAVLAQVSLSGSDAPLGLIRKAQQKVGERVAGVIRIRWILRVGSVENEVATREQALQVCHGEVRELETGLPGVATHCARKAG